MPGIETKDIIMWAGVSVAFLLQWYISHRMAKQNEERLQGELDRFHSLNIGDASEAAERYYKMLNETNERLENVRAHYEQRIDLMEKMFNAKVTGLENTIAGPYLVELQIDTRPELRISRHSVSVMENIKEQK